MATLSGQTIANTFDSILHVEDDTAGLVATAVDSRVIQDGVGQSSALALATDSVRITSTNKLYFNDAGAEEIHSASDGHLEVNSGTTLDITAPTVDINASTAVTVDGPSVAISSTSASEPVLHITNTHAGATAGEIRFNKDSASGADNDVMGTISWYGTDDDDNTHERLAYMDAIITDSAEGSEAASLRFYVAENDATLTKGLEIAGQPDDNAEVDVTIGAGASSTTTIAGNLSVTGTGAGASTIGALTDVTMDIANFVDGILIQTDSDGSAPTTGTLNGATGNVGIGKGVFSALTEGTYNTCFGYYAGSPIAAGTNNTCIGYAAGYGLSSGGNNLLLGLAAGQAGSPSGNISSESGEICLGNNSIGEAHVKVDWTIDSDERDKADIANFTHGLDYVNGLRPVNFVWDMRSDYVEKQSDEDGNIIPMTEEEIINVVRDGSKKGSDVQLGFIAQEVQAIEDSLGIDNNCIVDTKREDFYKMKSAKMIPVLVNAIKELSAKVEALENA